MSKLLVVGGPRHGERVSVDRYTTGGVVFPVLREPMRFILDDYTTPLHGGNDRVLATRRKVVVGQYVREILVAEGISAQTAQSYFFDVLIDAYDNSTRKL